MSNNPKTTTVQISKSIHAKVKAKSKQTGIKMLPLVDRVLGANIGKIKKS